MIQLTKQQIQAVAAAGTTPAVVVDPTTRTSYVLVRQEVYDRLTRHEYDDTPWTDAERDLLAAEVDRMLDDDMAIEDTAP
jgi:hypothetical protein